MVSSTTEIKRRVSNYWSGRAEAFSKQRLRELDDEISARWMAEFRKFIPSDKPLKILDLGTGTGFFAFLLEAEGHAVTGIDLTENMILEAKASAKKLGSRAEFYVMDAEKPKFPQKSFDALITRNLTWTLPNLPDAYSAWYGLLKPGGVLINFDADYCRENLEQEVPENHTHKTLDPKVMSENNSIKEELKPRQCARPNWDISLLSAVGFQNIEFDSSVYKRIYRNFDEFYNPTPIFMLSAYAAEGAH